MRLSATASYCLSIEWCASWCVCLLDWFASYRECFSHEVGPFDTDVSCVQLQMQAQYIPGKSMIAISVATNSTVCERTESINSTQPKKAGVTNFSMTEIILFHSLHVGLYTYSILATHKLTRCRAGLKEDSSHC